MKREEARKVAIGDLLCDTKTRTIFNVKDILYTTPFDMKHTNIEFLDESGNTHLHRNCGTAVGPLRIS